MERGVEKSICQKHLSLKQPHDTTKARKENPSIYTSRFLLHTEKGGLANGGVLPIHQPPENFGLEDV